MLFILILHRYACYFKQGTGDNVSITYNPMSSLISLPQDLVPSSICWQMTTTATLQQAVIIWD